MKSEYILITGSAGFIGAALSKHLIKQGLNVVGIDNMNSYYDVELKKARLNDICKISKDNNYFFYNKSIEDQNSIKEIFEKYQPKTVIHLAAQAGVRNSILNPSEYFQSNLVGFGNILEICRKINIKNLIYASSSSVYGGNENFPFKEVHNVNHPVSLYAATKRANELMAHSYSHLYNLPTIGLRFFTVYGPWGRPDMAPMIFAKAIFNRKPISIYNNGNMMRDFTYIDDIVESIYKCIDKPATIDKEFSNRNNNPDTSFAPFRIFNIGNGLPINLLDYIEILEESIGIEAIKEFKPMQPGDVKSTEACTKNLQNWIQYKPTTSISDGTNKFIRWYKNFYL